MYEPTMLTRKQCWRKAKVRVLTTSQCLLRCEKELEKSQIVESKKNIDGAILNSDGKNGVESVAGNPIKEDVSPKKTVRFSSMVYVLLIPSRKELSSHSGNLFWAEFNYSSFKKEAVAEIRALIQTRKCSAKEAIQFLYQPQPSDECWKLLPNISPAKNLDNDDAVKIDDDDLDYNFAGEEVIQFIECMKTDLELNKDFVKTEDAQHTQSHGNGNGPHSDADPNHSPSLTHMPMRTPSGAAGPNANMWAVQWRKGAEVH